MPPSNKKEINIDVITAKALVHQLELAAEKARAEQSYILCKAAVSRRRQELKECLQHGKDPERLERMLEKLEASLRDHARVLGRDLNDR